MSTEIDKFLPSLAAAVSAGLGITFTAIPRAVWAHVAVEKDSTPEYSVLRIYPGAESRAGFADARARTASVQCDTRSKDPAKCLVRAWAAYETLLDAQQRPRMHWAVAGWRTNAGGTAIEADPAGGWIVGMVQFTSGMPGIVGRDEADRSMAPFSFDVTFERAT